MIEQAMPQLIQKEMAVGMQGSRQQASHAASRPM